MAGVTLIALANGAGDVITAIVACIYIYNYNIKLEVMEVFLTMLVLCMDLVSSYVLYF